MLEDDEEALERESSERPALPRKRGGAHRGPGVVAMLALGVEITDEQ